MQSWRYNSSFYLSFQNPICSCCLLRAAQQTQPPSFKNLHIQGPSSRLAVSFPSFPSSLAHLSMSVSLLASAPFCLFPPFIPCSDSLISVYPSVSLSISSLLSSSAARPTPRHPSFLFTLTGDRLSVSAFFLLNGRRTRMLARGAAGGRQVGFSLFFAAWSWLGSQDISFNWNPYGSRGSALPQSQLGLSVP